MGFNKRHIDKDRIISAFKHGGSKGVSDLFNADAIFMETNSPICHYIEKIMSKNESIEYKIENEHKPQFHEKELKIYKKN